jgi:ParB/RepB/Spo0J family partition protein
VALTLDSVWLDQITGSERLAPPPPSLLDSLVKYGQSEPIHVQEAGVGAYDLVHGSEIVAGARALELKTLDAIVATDRDAALPADLRALIIDAQCQNLRQLYRARHVSRLVAEGRFTQAQLARELNKSRAYIHAMVQVIECPDLVAAIEEEALQFGAAKSLASLTPAERGRLLAELRGIRRLTGEFPTVRYVEAKVDRLKKGEKALPALPPEFWPALSAAAQSQELPVEIQATPLRQAQVKVTMEFTASEVWLRAVLADYRAGQEPKTVTADAGRLGTILSRR